MMTHRVLHLVCISRPGLLVHVLTSCALLLTGPSRAVGQDRLLDWLPHRPAIYVWSDSFPELLADIEPIIENLQSDLDEATRIEDLAGARPATSDVRQPGTRGLADTTEILAEIWGKLHDEQLFDGDFAIVILPEIESRDEFEQHPNIIRPNRQITVVNWRKSVVLAQTSASETEIAELFGMLIALMNPEQGESDADASQAGREKTFGSWRVTDGWFCWASGSDQVDSWLALLSESEGSYPLLRNDRTFKRAMSNLGSARQAQPSLSVFMTADALPAASSVIAAYSFRFSKLDPAAWRSLFLHDLRAVGCDFFISEPHFEESLDATIAFDAFAVTTSPRHGILRGIGTESLDTMTLSYPIVDVPLASFQYLAIDGEELHHGLNEINRTQDNDSLFRYVLGMSEVAYVGLPQRPNRAATSKCLVTRLSDPEAYRTLWESTYPEYSITSGADAGSPIVGLDGSDIWLTNLSAESLAAVRNQHEEQLAMIKKFGSPANVEAVKRNMTANLEWLDRPTAVTIGEWKVSSASVAISLSDLISNYGRPHPQLEELNRTVAAMRTSFGNEEPLAAIISQWSDGPWQEALVRSGMNRQDFSNWQEELRRRSDELSDSELELLNLQRLIYDRMHEIVVTISTESAGFRANGVLIGSANRKAGEN